MDPLVWCLDEAHAAPNKLLGHGPAGNLLGAPQVRRSQGIPDCLSGRGLFPHGLRRLGHDQARAAKLPVDPDAAVIVDGRPVARQHIQAVVDHPIAGPGVRQCPGRYHVGLPAKLREILPGKDVPAPVPPRLPKAVRQVVQILQIARIAPHQIRVIRGLGLNEHIVLRALGGAERAVHKQTLDPHVPHAAGVAGQVHALGKVVHAPDAGRQGRKLVLGEVRRLIDEDHVVFLPLILVHVVLAGAVAKHDP